MLQDCCPGGEDEGVVDEVAIGRSSGLWQAS
jgi:hypothetical protein